MVFIIIKDQVFFIQLLHKQDGFYIYLAPNILANKLKINSSDAFKILHEKKHNWAIKNNLNLEKER